MSAQRSKSASRPAMDNDKSREPLAALDYIRQMLCELRQVAEHTGEGTLVYMIEMAALEAEESHRLRKRADRRAG